MPASEAQKRATAKYRAKTYEQIAIELPKGTRDRWKAAAAEAGGSLAGFIKAAVEEKIQSDGLHAAPAADPAPEE